jgi:hypothetical protein
MISGGAAPHDHPISRSGAARLKPRTQGRCGHSGWCHTWLPTRCARRDNARISVHAATYIKVQRRYVLAPGTALCSFGTALCSSMRLGLQSRQLGLVVLAFALCRSGHCPLQLLHPPSAAPAAAFSASWRRRTTFSLQQQHRHFATPTPTSLQLPRLLSAAAGRYPFAAAPLGRLGAARCREREREGLELVVCVQDEGGAMWWDSIGTARS